MEATQTQQPKITFSDLLFEGNKNNLGYNYNLPIDKLNDEIEKLEIERDDTIRTSDDMYTSNDKIKELEDLSVLFDVFSSHRQQYETLTNQTVVHPYFDIDINEGEKQEIYNKLMLIISSLNGYNFSISGYSIYKFDDFEWLENKQYKALSVHIIIYSVNVIRANNFKEYIKENYKSLYDICDQSVYKDNGKTQKMRFGFSNKQHFDKEANQWITQDKGCSMWADYTQTHTHIHKKPPTTYQQLIKCLITAQFTDIKSFDIYKGYNEPRHDGANRTAEFNQFDYNINGDAVLLDIEQLNELINECVNVPSYTDIYKPYDKKTADIRPFLLHCPYKLIDIYDVLISWYNSKQHDNGTTPFIDYINKCYNYEPNNKIWLYVLINPLNKKWRPNEAIDWSDELEQEFNNLINKTNDKLSKKQRNRKNELLDLRNESIDNFKKSLTDEDKKKINIFKKWKNIFNNKKFIIEPYNTNDFIKNCFRGCDGWLYIKDDLNGYKSISKEQIINMGGNSEIIQKLPIIDINNFMITKFYGNIILNNEDYKAAHEALEIYAETFNEFNDFVYYCRWLSMKLRRPNVALPRSIVQLEGSGSFKTNFIKAFNKFLTIAAVDFENDLTNQFNEFMLSQLVVIDEVKAQGGKKQQMIQNTIKQMTSDNSTKIRVKYERNGRDIKLITNLIINSNYKNCGGLFDNQSKDGEIFRRFKIIQKKQIEQNKAEKLYNMLNNNRVIYALYNVLINEYKDMTFNEFNNKSNFEVNYYDYVKDKAYNKAVLTKNEIDYCISQYGNNKLLSIQRLVQQLKKYDIICGANDEKQRLIDESIIEYKQRRNYIIDYNKLIELYIDVNICADIEDNSI